MAENSADAALPARPSLEYLRKLAKARLTALRVQRPDAKLADAQLLVARDHGFGSWRAMAAKINADADPAAVETRRRQFRGAVNAGRLDDVRELLETDPDLANAPVFGFDSRPVQHVNGNLATLDLLLQHGADLNLKSTWWAGGWGVFDFLTESESDRAYAEALIARGAVVDVFAAANLDKFDRLRELIAADPRLVHAKGGDGGRPLHFAKSEAAIDLLLAAGAEIDARDVDHESTAVQWQLPRLDDTADARAAALRRVGWLLDRGATPDVFLLAALGDEARLAALLDADPAAATARVGSKHYPPCPDAPGRHIYLYKMSEGRTAYEIARAFGHDACAALMLSRVSTKDRFLAACAVGDATGAADLLRAEPDLIVGLTPLDQTALPMAAWAGESAAVKLMLDLGFDPLAVGVDTGTALHCAAWHGRAAMVRMILDHPAVAPRRAELINAKEKTYGSTPLGWCCHGSTIGRNAAGDYPAVATLLLASGGEPGPNRGDASADVERTIKQFHADRS